MTRVSVILVNYRGADDTISAVHSLLESDWPIEDLEVVVVDNDSGDRSLEKLKHELPDCTVIDSGSNLGFAGGCNFGAAHSTGEILAFLNSDAKPDRRWIAEAVAAINEDSKIGCVATKVLDWAGEKIDYVDSSLTWYGMGYKREAGVPDTGEWDTPKNVLFPTGSSMFVPKSVFTAFGGFDERFFMFYEDVDFGWRLNLGGYDVRYVPTSVCFHKHHASMNKFGEFRERFLLERNALMCAYKNFGPELLRAVFAPALALSIERAASMSLKEQQSDEDPYAQKSKSIAKTAATSPYAISSFVDMLPSLAASRKEIQSSRVISDAQITVLMRNAMEPAYPLPQYLKAYETFVDFFHIDEMFATQAKILIVTGDVLGRKMAGPAIRAWEMAKRLSVEHAVRLISTAPGTERTSQAFIVASADRKEIKEHIAWADVIVFQGFLLNDQPGLCATDKIIVVDIYDPIHLEQLEQARDQGPKGRNKTIAEVTEALNRQLLRGDFFLCASEKQRQLWLGQLAACGRINRNNFATEQPVEELVAICPFGLDDEPPVQTEHAIRGRVDGIAPEDKIVIWGGGVYNWFDPLSLIRAIAKLSETHPDIRLYFLGMKHPNPNVPTMRVARDAIALAKSLGLTDKYVFFNHDWVPYEQRQNYLLDADVGVSTHFEHIETQFSFRTRILDYLWASLPIVATKGDSFGNLLDTEGIGISVPPEDVESLATALETLLYDDAKAKACSVNIKRFSHAFEWNNALAPLLDFCRDPQRAGDLKFNNSHELAPVINTSTIPVPDLKRDIGLVFSYLKEGGPRVVLSKAHSRMKKYLK